MIGELLTLLGALTLLVGMLWVSIWSGQKLARWERLNNFIDAVWAERPWRRKPKGLPPVNSGPYTIDRLQELKGAWGRPTGGTWTIGNSGPIPYNATLSEFRAIADMEQIEELKSTYPFHIPWELEDVEPLGRWHG